MRLRRPVKLWRGRDARECILTVELDGVVLVSAPWLRPQPCARCGRLTTMRWHEFFAPVLWPVHAECARATRRELVSP